jgi:hypothetical protein
VLLPEIGNKCLLWSDNAKNIPIRSEELNSLEEVEQP